LRQGVLVEVQRRSARVAEDGGRECDCAYSPEIDLREFSGFAVGDRVEFFPGDGSQEPLITAILPRKSKIARPGPGERYARELVLAANVDLLAAVFSPRQPDFNPRLLDRYLAIAEHFGVEALICLNKADLAEEIPAEARYLESLGYAFVFCSALTGEGLHDLRDKLRGRQAVLSGPSGVGKTSLVSALFPEAEVRVGALRSGDGKGRHTTTTSRMHVSQDGLRLIDTPGLRELGLWGVKPSEVARLWRDFAPFLEHCRFKDCMHRSEPGCAVRAAAAAGNIPEFRLESYYRVLDTLGKTEEWE
jgi:ribosome biogenesis GTPase